MILVSYIDILDYIGDDRQCLIEGEELFNENRVRNVQVSCRVTDDAFEVSALCLCREATDSKNFNISIDINQGEKKKLSSKCSCEPDRFGKCQHVAAILIHLHRNPSDQSQENFVAKQVSNSVTQNLFTNGEAKDVKEQEQGSQRKLRQTRRSTVILNTKKDESKDASIKPSKKEKEYDEEAIDDPTWDKENDGEEDEALDWGQSSDDEWKPTPGKKRIKREIPLLPSKDTKEISKNRKKRNRMTKAEAERKAKELTSAIQQGDDGHFSCLLCDVKLAKLSELQGHIRDIHLLKKEIFTCNKCDGTFRLLRSLKAHEAICDVHCEEENELSPHGEATPKRKEQTLEEDESDGESQMEPLQCLLCEVVSSTRREMHDHYLLTHRVQEKDSVCVCDRCGEFRLPRDHICPSQLSFRCHMCRSPFKAGRDYWNHLIRASNKHAPSASSQWRCGWARCAERFPSEKDLLAHVRLHIPAKEHLPLMCGVCSLLLRNTDAKVVHMERHAAGVYECAACRHACGDKEALRQHWETHATERPHLCNTCGWRFASAAALQVHTRKFHEGGPFSCAKCPQKFDDRTDVRIHFGAAHGKRRCTYPGCTYRCANQTSMDRHASLAHSGDAEDGEVDPDDPPPPPARPPPPPSAPSQDDSTSSSSASLSCPTCGESFPLRRALRAHVRDVHGGVAPAVTCPDCQKPFKSQRDLDEHRRLHTGERPFVCAECGVAFKRAQNLEYHTKGAHKDERNFECPECAKRFISNADMKRHLRYSHQGGKKWHLCPHCGHRLPSLYNLKLHVQSRHTAVRPHKCPQCDMGFVAASDLKKHVMFKHNKEHPFACAQCDKRYQRRRDLELHRQRHHDGVTHTCTTCNKDFATHASMMQHSRYHTTEEPYQCAKCGRRFPHRMNLSRHLCTPDIKKNYRCATCGLSFTTSGSLKSHRRRLHAGEDPQQALPAPQEGQQVHQQDHQQEQQAEEAATLQQQPQGYVQPDQQALGAQEQGDQPGPQQDQGPEREDQSQQQLQQQQSHQATQQPSHHHAQPETYPQAHGQTQHPPHQERHHQTQEPTQQQVHQQARQQTQQQVPHQPHQQQPHQPHQQQPHQQVQHQARLQERPVSHRLQAAPPRQMLVQSAHQTPGQQHHVEVSLQAQAEAPALAPGQGSVHAGHVYEDYSKDKLWRGLDSWGMGPTVPTTATLAGEETILTLTGCSTYHELESAQPHPGPSGMHLLTTAASAEAQQVHAQHAVHQAPAAAPAVLRYEAPPSGVATPPTTTLVMKALPPPLVSLHVKTETCHPHMMYAPPASAPTPAPAPLPVSVSSMAPTVKLISMSQPPPLTSISTPHSSSASSSAPSSAPGLNQGGLILGAPIQTTADGSFHLVFVPHGTPAASSRPC